MQDWLIQSFNEIERIDTINKSKKEQDQFGKINKMNIIGKTGQQINLK